MTDKEDLFIEIKTLEQKIKQAQKHLEKMDSQLEELKIVKAAVDEFTALEPGAEMKVPLANGVYVSATLKDPDKMLVNVGANVVVQKKPEEVRKIIAEQEEEVTKHRAKLLSQFHQMIERVEEIQGEFE